MQESRLFKIVYKLLENKLLTANQLADEFEVSIRTIYRDIERLSSSGIPIYCTKERNGGISLLDNYVLDKELISKSEQLAILSSLQGLSALLENKEKDLVSKLNAIFKNKIKDWIEVDFSNWGNNFSDKEKFSKIKNAIINRYIIQFNYINSNGEKKTRTVKPLKIHFKYRAWYLQAYCADKKGLRFFKISRISNLKVNLKTFEDEFVLQNIEFDNISCEYTPIKLSFDREVEYRIYDEFDINSILEVNENHIIVEVKMPQDKWLYGYLMSFCENVEILSPNSLKEDFKVIVENTYKKYWK